MGRAARVAVLPEVPATGHLGADSKQSVDSRQSRTMGAGGHLDRLGLSAVPGHRPQLVGVSADHVRQGVRVSLIALGPRRAVPFPVPGHLPRVDRIDGVTGLALSAWELDRSRSVTPLAW